MSARVSLDGVHRCTLTLLFACFRRDTRPQLCNEEGFFYFDKGIEMPTIKIDEVDYDLDLMSDEAKAQLASIQFVDAELARLQSQVAVLQTARMAYANVLKGQLTPQNNDIIKFS
jgi:hypothetical protein